MNNGIYGFGSSLVASNPYGPYGISTSNSTVGSVQVLIVAGGSGGSTNNVTTRTGIGGGGGGVIDSLYWINISTTYTITVGAGGTGGSSPTTGSFSRFGDLTAAGGGLATGWSANRTPYFPHQGFASGNNATISTSIQYGGGGGAGGLGADATTTASGNGGMGRLSLILGTSTYFGGGGGSGGNNNTGTIATPGIGGLGGGGAGGGSSPTSGTAGTTNTGGGGGGGAAQSPNGTGAAGGSGIVILRWNSSTMKINISAGLTYTTSSVGSDTVVTFTGGTGTVSWS